MTEETTAAGVFRRFPRLLRRWPGRVLLRSTTSLRSLEVFDRSMTIAAQFFTSVVPILIILATWRVATDRMMSAMRMPEESQLALEDAVRGAGSGTFGLVGVLVVLISATSLSRALNRAFAAIWGLPRPHSRLGSAWRWLSVVLAFALTLVVVHTVSGTMAGLPPHGVWPVTLTLCLDLGIAVFVPWVLLAGAVRPRLLVPGAMLFALAMTVVRPTSAAWLPRALEVSADRYGSIGVAFTYLTWLYAMSLCFLIAAVVGQVIASDGGRLGKYIHAV